MSEKTAKAERKAESVKGYRIDVRPYKVKALDYDDTGKLKTDKGKPVYTEDDFDVQGSLCDILFNRELQNKPEAAFKAHDLAEKIRAAKTYVILDNAEFNMIKAAYDKLSGVTENMVEFLRRIRDAEEVSLEVNETKK